MTIRALEPSDDLALHALVTHPDVARTLGGSPYDALSVTREQLARRVFERTLSIGAFDEQGALVGAAELDGMAPVRRRHAARLWVAVRPERARRGIASALVSALLRAADEWMGFVRIELGVHADHAPAIALYEKHGFQIEATSPAKMLRDGALVTAHEMARLRPGYVPPVELGVAPPITSRGERAKVVVRVREARDLDAFTRLHQSASVMEGTFQLPLQPRAMWERRFAEPPPGARILAAEIDGQTVGALGLFPLGSSPRLAHVVGVGMSVAPEAQGCGVGDALMRSGLELADRWWGLARVELEVFVDNERAQRLYERHGFVREGRLRAYAFRRGTYVDAFVMARVRARP